MSRVILVCGATGAGKTTYAIALSKDIHALRFSIDPWMQTLFAADMKSLDYTWMIERVHRCYEQIWDVCEKMIAIDGDVVLDLGFTEKSQRKLFSDRARALGIDAEVHYLSVPSAVRRARVDQRNSERDPDVYAFEVTNDMFDFMEPRFEAPDDVELKNGIRLDSP